MTRMMRAILIVAVCTVWLSGFAPGFKAGADNPDPGKIVKKVRKVLDDLDTFSCSFITMQEWSDHDRDRKLTGRVFMRLGDDFRLRVERPNNLTVIDGVTIWTYLPKHNQVQITDYSGDVGNFPSPNSIFRRYSKERTPVVIGEDVIGGNECDVLMLESSKPDDVNVTVWIDRTLNVPVKAVQGTPEGSVMTHILGDVKLNEALPDSMFQFTPPEDAVRVDMRE